MSTTNLSLSDVSTPATAATWLSAILSGAATLQLPVTAWQSGGIARTILSLMSWGLSSQDGLISMAVQGGFLDFAASGTVTLTNPVTGTTTIVPVTVDPSTLAPAAVGSWLPGWLDILADGSYNCQRITATYAGNNLALTNTQGSGYGPYAAGTYHVASSVSATQTYTNTSTFTIAAANYIGGGVAAASSSSPITITTSSALPASFTTGQAVTISGVLGNSAANGTFLVTVTGASTFSLQGTTGSGAYTGGGTVNVCTLTPFSADQIGVAGNAVAGTLTSPVTSLVGVTVSNPTALTGTNYESNTALAARCRLKLQSLSNGGPSGAYKFYALSASQFTSLALAQGPATRVTTTASSGQVTTTVANANGAVPGAIGAVVSAANNGSGLIRLQLVSASGMATNQIAVVSGIGGVSAANGTWTITYVDSTHIDLQGSVFSGSYVSGGEVQAGDLGVIDSVIQAYAVPQGITAFTQSASSLSVTVAASVYVPAAQVAAYTASYQALLTSYFSTFPIGGVVTDGSATGVLPIGVVEGLLYQAGILNGSATSVVTGITGLTLNAGTADLAVSATQVPSANMSINVVGQ